VGYGGRAGGAEGVPRRRRRPAFVRAGDRSSGLPCAVSAITSWCRDGAARGGGGSGRRCQRAAREHRRRTASGNAPINASHGRTSGGRREALSFSIALLAIPPHDHGTFSALQHGKVSVIMGGRGGRGGAGARGSRTVVMEALPCNDDGHFDIHHFVRTRPAHLSSEDGPASEPDTRQPAQLDGRRGQPATAAATLPATSRWPDAVHPDSPASRRDLHVSTRMPEEYPS
jgi:hypothetical protein